MFKIIKTKKMEKKIQDVEKAISCAKIFNTHRSHKNGPWARAFLYQEIKSLTCCTGLVALYGNIFPWFRFSVDSFVLLKHVCHMAAGQTCDHIYPLQSRSGGSSDVVQEERVQAHCPALAARMDLLEGPAGMCYGRWSWPVSSLYEWSIVHPVFDSDTKVKTVQTSTPDNRQQMPLAQLKISFKKKQNNLIKYNNNKKNWKWIELNLEQ